MTVSGQSTSMLECPVKRQAIVFGEMFCTFYFVSDPLKYRFETINERCSPKTSKTGTDRGLRKQITCNCSNSVQLL